MSCRVCVFNKMLPGSINGQRIFEKLKTSYLKVVFHSIMIFVSADGLALSGAKKSADILMATLTCYGPQLLTILTSIQPMQTNYNIM